MMDTNVLSVVNKLTYYSLRSFGRVSDSVRLGFQRGFDSGEMMDRIYQNRPSGRFGIGRILDRIYLNQSGCRGLRGRKALLQATLRAVIDEQRHDGLIPFIMDIASGPATYLIQFLSEDREADLQALARDLDPSGLRRGEVLASQYGVTNIRFQLANALDEASLLAIQPQPTIIISSGFYEILNDDELVRQSMSLVRKCLSPGCTFIFTTQVHHPQLELIKALPNREDQSWVMKNRPVALVEGWAQEAGFRELSTQLEPLGIFSVTTAR